jgi:hypothetical protein
MVGSTITRKHFTTLDYAENPRDKHSSLIYIRNLRPLKVL